jgi:hypothetical protein
LTQPGAPTCLRLQLFCESSLSVQLSFLAQICSHFSTFFSNVEDLCISATQPSGQMDSPYSGQWLELINSFTSAKWFHLDGNHSTNIVCALQLPERQCENVLPALHKLYILHPGPRHAPLRKAVASFMTSRCLSGHPIEVEYE